MAEGHRSLDRNGEREEMETVRSGRMDNSIGNSSMREKRKTKQPFANRECAVRMWKRRVLLIDYSWLKLDGSWTFNTRRHLNYCYFVECFVFINHSVWYHRECPKHGGIIWNILKFTVKYRVESIYHARKFALRAIQNAAHLNEKFARGSTWEVYFLIMFIYLRDKRVSELQQSLNFSNIVVFILATIM